MSFTLYKKNPTPGEITSSLTNASDAAGLHFADGGYIDGLNSAGAEFGTSDFSIEFILNQTEDNTVDNYIYFTHTSGDSRLYVRNDISENLLRITWVNSGGGGQARDIAYDMSADYGTPTHYVLACDRSGDATLYKNGNSVGSVDISAESSIDLGAANTTASRIGSSATYGVIGTFYRFRTWNKALSSTEVTATYENATVPFADQYGSETELNASTCVNGTSSNAFTTYTGASASGFTAASDGAGSTSQFAATVDEISFVEGKKYSITFDATLTSGAAPQWNAVISILSATGTTDHSIETVVAGANGGIFTANQTTTGVVSFKDAGGAASSFAISNLKVVRAGCVADYDLAFANPTQSDQVQDRSTNLADGTASSGVTQVAKIEAVNTNRLNVGGTLPLVGIGLAAGTAPSYSLDVNSGVGNTALNLVSTDPSVTVRMAGENTTNNKVFTRTADSLVICEDGGNVGVGVTPKTWYAGFSALQLSDTGAIWSENVGGESSMSIGENSYVAADGSAKYLTTDEASTYQQNNGTHSFRVAASGTADAAITWTDALSISAAGQTAGTGSLDGDWVFKTTNSHANGYGAVVIAGGSTSSQTAFEVRKNTSDVALKIDCTGLVTASNGIAFSGQTDASGTGITSGATTLDHYEEGTFTPTLGGSTTDPTVSYAIQVGVYTRVGNLVTCRISVGTSANTGGSGYIKIGGFPFTQKNASDYRSLTCISAYNFDADAATFQLAVSGIVNTTEMYLLESKDSASWATPTWTQATNAAVYFNGEVTYWV